MSALDKNIRRLLFFLFFMSAMVFCKSETQSDWVAKVGNSVITLKEFNTKFDILLKLNFTSGQIALLKDNPNIKKEILKSIIAQKIILREMEKTHKLPSSQLRVLELQALAQYFIYTNVIPNIDIPSDEFLKAKYSEKRIKSILERSGIKNFEEAKSILVAEYQKAKYISLLKSSLEKLKYKYRIKTNDEFEENVIKRYIKGEIKPEEYSKLWIVKIEDRTYYVKDIEDMIRTNILLSGSKEALKKYDDLKDKSDIRASMLNEIIGVLLVKTDAEKQGWINDQRVKDFITVFIDNAKTQIYIKAKIAKNIKKPSLRDALAYYNKNKSKIKRPFDQVKDGIIYNLWLERVKLRAQEYIDKLISENKIEINDAYFKKEKKEKGNK